MSVIELGSRTADDDEPVRSPVRRPFDRRRARRVAALLVGLLCLATLHASAVPVPRGLTGTWSVPFAGGDSFALAGDDVYLLHAGRRQVLTAYALATGAVRWSRELAYSVTSMETAEAAGVLLLPAGERSVETRTDTGDVLWTRYSTETVALDGGTGRQLWRATGDVAVVRGDSVLLIDHTADGIGAKRLRLVDLRDGATRWARDAPGVYQWATVGADPAHPTRLVTMAPGGEMQVYRFADGADVARGRVPWHTGSLTDNTFSELVGGDELIYIFAIGENFSAVTAYAPDTLRFRWRIAGDALSSPGNCGAVLCLPTENGLAGRDWLTGAERWRVAGHNFAQPIPDGLLLTYGADEVNHAILSERTGRVLGDVGTGQAAADPTAGTVAVFTRTRSPAGRTAIARLDPRTGELFPLGTIDSVIDGLWCQLRGERLACATTTGRLVVTAVG